MTCANHPSAETKAYCQQCGKPLCAECARPVGGTTFCEPCLHARLATPPAGTTQEIFPASQSHPALAALLGLIPGVGAMYNGQFVKALAHVLIFAVFASLSHDSDVFGLLTAAWVFYQVFDAYQTAKARRDGLPLPNPFGLNDLGARLGIAQNPHPAAAQWTPEVPGGGPAARAASTTSSSSPYSAYSAATPAYTTVPEPPAIPPTAKAPIGAIALIAIGLFFLLHTLGILSARWLHRGWPLAIIFLGVWLLYSRMHERYPGGPQ
jgi:TM2 domain-containing membrane protein YozV